MILLLFLYMSFNNLEDHSFLTSTGMTFVCCWKGRCEQHLKGITTKPFSFIYFSDILQQKSSTNDDSSSSFGLYDQLSYSYPSLLQPLIHERDTVRMRDALLYLQYKLFCLIR